MVVASPGVSPYGIGKVQLAAIEANKNPNAERDSSLASSWEEIPFFIMDQNSSAR